RNDNENLGQDNFPGGVDPRTGIDFGNAGDRFAGEIKSYSPGGERGGGGYGFISCPAVTGGDSWFSTVDLPMDIQMLHAQQVRGVPVIFSLRPSREGKRQAKAILWGDLGGPPVIRADG
ncbi:unnamed protein product, partial [Polarella glacialis]